MRDSVPLSLLETDRRTTREQAYEALRRGILGGALEAGTRLVQSENLTDKEVIRATDLQDLMDEERDLGVWVELNNQFHAVFDDSKSPRMNAILRNLRDSAALVVGFSNRVRPTLIDASNRQHHLLLKACRERDRDAAAKIVEEHVRETLEAMERYFADANDPQS